MTALDGVHSSPDHVVVPPVRVLYVAGSGRSGTTLVDSVLGQQPGVWSGGEIRYLWERGILADRLCGCGVPFSECPAWSGVLERLDATVNPEEMIRAEHATSRIRALPRLCWRKWRNRPVADGALNGLGNVYRAIQERTHATIVDSSKLPTYAAILDDNPGVDVAIVHVVRDPRATAYSWARTKVLRDFGDERAMQRLPAWKAATLWLVWHATTEVLWGRTALRVRYEDFVAAPAAQTARIATFADLEFDQAAFRPGPEVHLDPTHSVAGNPSRHRTGWVPVRQDDEWVTGLSRRNFLLVTLITWPLLLAYRYPIRRRGGGQRG
jgi:hypothetical protein